MNPEPFSFQYPVADFDLSNVPVDPAILRENSDMLVSAIQTYYAECFRELGGRANVLVKDGAVSVSWYPEEGDASEQISNYATSLLQRGDFRSAEPLLRALLAWNPNHADTLLNLGMMLSDQNKLDEALEILERLVEVTPDNTHGWTALGVAQARNGSVQEAVTSLQRALEIDPQNAYALKNAGALLVKQSPRDALPFLEQAAQLLPRDQATQYGYAECLMKLGRTNEAAPIFLKIIELNPLSDIAEFARKARTSMAGDSLRNAVGGMIRPDAVMYCLDGLQKFRTLGDSKTRAIVFEVALLGRDGLDINDPSKQYKLKSLPGTFTGLHLVSLMYTGMKLIDPNVDAGIDLSREYAAALERFESETPD
jgi:tetratricopeptide (TPR) repeat protein